MNRLRASSLRFLAFSYRVRARCARQTAKWKFSRALDWHALSLAAASTHQYGSARQYLARATDLLEAVRLDLDVVHEAELAAAQADCEAACA